MPIKSSHSSLGLLPASRIDFWDMSTGDISSGVEFTFTTDTITTATPPTYEDKSLTVPKKRYVMGECELIFKPTNLDFYIGVDIDDVIFSHSKRTDKWTTIVKWSDGAKTMVTTCDGEYFSKEAGIEQCIIKRVVGNRSKLKKIFKEWCTE